MPAEVVEVWYWYTQGFVQAARYMLKAKNKKITEKHYNPETIKDWHAVDKFEILKDNNFANLPLLKLDDGKIICQSRAVILYVAELTGYVGQDLYQKVEAETLAGFWHDVLMQKFIKNACVLPNTENYENNKHRLNEEIIEALKQIEKQLQKFKFLTGNTLTYADFMWFQLINMLTRWSQQVKDMSWTHEYLENVRAEAGEHFREYDTYVNRKVYFAPKGYLAWGCCVPNEMEIDVDGVEV